MKLLSFLLLILLGLLPQTSFAYTNETFSPNVITLSAYEMARVTIDTKGLNIPLVFSKDFTMTINSTTGSTETQLSFYFPFSKIAANLPYFRFRLFNFGSDSTTFNITFSCLRTTATCAIANIARVLTVEILLPSRAIYGTSAVFAIVLTNSLLSDISLPLNLYSQTDEIFVDFMVPEFYNGFNYSSLTSDEQVFDSSYWNAINTVTMPWLPFFTHCTGQDKRLLLYDILENSPDSCVYKAPDQIKIINNIPTTGFAPVTDSCDLSYTCYHVQTGKGKSYGSPWYSITGSQTLYYIYRNPISIESMINLKSDQNDPFFQNLINNNVDSLIPVVFKTADSTPQTGVPLHVDMKISFFQASTTERDIISVEVTMSDYYGSVSDAALPYTLTITYEALDYFGMINSFRVGFVVYFVVFLFISIVVLLGAYVIWRINKLIFSHKKKMHPTIKFYATFKLTFIPQLTGSFLATLSTILVFSLIAKYFQQFIDFTSFTPNFNDSSIDSAEQLEAERGRIGLACLFFSMFVMNKGMSLLIPIPTKDETKVIVRNLTKKRSSKNKSNNTSFSSNSSKSMSNDSASALLEGKDSDKSSDQDSSDSAEEKEQLSKVEGSSIIMGLKRKQNHVMLICLLAALTLVFVIEPSGATSNDESATKSSTFLMVILMVVDVIVILLLKHFLLKEILLLAPITTAFEIVQFVLVMRADTFTSFLLQYLLRTLLIVAFRIYLDPVLKNLEVYVQKIWLWILLKSNKRHLDTSHTSEMLRWRNVELILNHSLKHKGHYSKESIIFILVNYTTKQCARLMFPIYLLFLYVFPNENQITELLGINQRELLYYLAFWAFLMIPSFVTDVYILNILEIVHGHKLFDYLSYCEYRFNFRTTKWIASSRQMDRSVGPEYRSIHNFCFSQQFYFTITVATWGILLFTSAIYILYANDYQPFSDALLIPMLFIVLGIFLALSYVFSKASTYIDIWRQPRKVVKEPSKRVEEEKKRLESHLEVDKIIKTNFFRLLFIRENKDWIISNLKNFIHSENFHDNEGYLLRIYQKLADEEVREGNERKKNEFIKQKKYEHLSQLTLKDLKLATEEHLNSGSQSNIQEEKIPKVKKSIVKPLTYLLYHWFYFAKQNMYLMNLVADIDNSNLANQCFKCGQEYALKLVPQKPLVNLLGKYRIMYAGLPFNKYDWRKFYEKEQQFKTFCDDCKFIDFMKKRKNVRTKSRTGNTSRFSVSELNKSSDHKDTQDHSGMQLDPFESPEPEGEEKPKIEVEPALKRFLLALHWAAKSKLLHKEKKPVRLSKQSSIKKKRSGRSGIHENNLSLQGLSDEDDGAAGSGEDNDADNEGVERDIEMVPITARRNLEQKNKGSESARS